MDPANPRVPDEYFEWEYSHDETYGQRLSYPFDQPVSITSDDLELTNLTTGQVVGPDDLILHAPSGGSNIYQFTFSDSVLGSGGLDGVTFQPTFPRVLPNGNYEAVLNADRVTAATGPSDHLDGNGDGVGGDDNHYNFYFLAGDTNHDGLIDGIDYGQIDGAINNPPEWEQYQDGDFDYNGYIDGIDYGLLDGTINFGSILYATQITPPPSEPNQLTATAAIAPNQINLNWNPPAGDMPDGYHIYKSTDGGKSFALIDTVVGGGNTSWEDPGLHQGAKHYYRVRAYTDAAGNSVTTNKVFSVTALPGPNGLIATSVSTISVALSWNDNSADETSFEVWQSADGGAWFKAETISGTHSGTAMSTTMTGLDSGKSYAFRVQAATIAQTSMPTLHINVQTLPSEGTPATISGPDSVEEGAWVHLAASGGKPRCIGGNYACVRASEGNG